MKFLHIADLHIGKRLHEQPLINEQRRVLGELLRIAQDRSAQAVLIAGDVYDRSIPPVDAVEAFDDFITELSERGISVFIIAGNHDSPERLDFGARILSKRNVYISGNELKTVALSDSFGDVYVWLLPYMHSAKVTETLESCGVDEDKRNIMVAHQFVISGGTEPEQGGSEIPNVGGIDAVDAGLFKRFDYVALGHIHRPQSAGANARYSGSPYRYSFDECSHEKSAVLIDIRRKTEVSLEFVKLTPERDLYRLKCKLGELSRQTAPKDAYIEVTLTDEEPVIDAISKTREIYPNTLKLIIENRYSQNATAEHRLTKNDVKTKNTLELFENFFEVMNGAPLNAAQRELVIQTIQSGAEDETG
jgi:exonuclease SbcD